MKLILISGNGIGAGKTTLADQLSDHRMSHATELRHMMCAEFPEVDWYDTTQEGKLRPINKPNGTTVREALIGYGQGKCAADQVVWARTLGDRLDEDWVNTKFGVYLIGTVAVDDLRKVCELEHLRSRFPDLVHVHLKYAAAIPEPQYDADELEALANYVITRR